MLLQMTLFHSFLWLSSIPLWICTTFMSTHLDKLQTQTKGKFLLTIFLIAISKWSKNKNIFSSLAATKKNNWPAMAPHSSTLAWKIPWTEEPGSLQSMGSLRVRQDWSTSLSLFTFMHWRWKWQPTPVFLPGESQGRGSLVGCRLCGHTESDTTEVT